MVQVRLLGAFEIRSDGGQIDMRSRAAESLFAFLILNAGTPCRREKLAGMFWPDSSEARARASLRHELWRIRKALAAGGAQGALLTDDFTVALCPSRGVATDLDALRNLPDCAGIDELASALGTYRGELLPGFYEDWVGPERDRIWRLYEQRMRRLLDLLEGDRRWLEVIDWSERWLVLDSQQEAGYRALLVAFAALGDRAKARATLERCAQALKPLGLEPSREILQLEQSTPAAHNLPSPLTSFVGRQRERREVAALLRDSRLVTLTGAGGVGKTRLAIEVARDVALQYPDGVCYLALATVQDPATVAEALLGPLQIRGGTGTPLEALRARLQTRQMLLVIDSCEHLLEASAQLVQELLTACPGVHVLATSRQPLRVEGELAYRVPSLEVPSPDTQPSAVDLQEIPSVQLFVERAKSCQGAFSVTPQNAVAIAQICQHLDGIPLAIELAAGSVATLPVQDLSSHLEDRFAVLTAGARAGLPRHRTLRLMIDASHDLLTAPERTVFRRLSVFSGGWTLEAAQAVAADGGLDGLEVMASLAQLVEKCLVELDADANRYSMLETIRLYALERLREAAEEASSRARHLDYFVMHTERLRADMEKDLPTDIELAQDFANIMAAINLCITADGGTQKALRLIGNTSNAWNLVRQYQSVCSLARTFLALPEARPRNLWRRRTLTTLASLSFQLGRMVECREASEEGLSIAQELGDSLGEALSLLHLGNSVSELGDSSLGWVYLERGRHSAEQLGNVRLTSAIKTAQGETLRLLERLSEAEQLYEECAAASRSVDATRPEILARFNLLTVAIQRGDLACARARMLELCSRLEQVPFRGGLAGEYLDAIAAFLSASGDWQHAALVWGAVARQHALDGTIYDRADAMVFEPLEARTREALGEEGFKHEVERGSALTALEVVRQAREWVESSSAK